MKGLYIRSVYFLGFTSGGSVTHTSGVVNALSSKIALDVVSNEKLPGVDQSTIVQVVEPVLRKIPVLNELVYNFKILNAVKNRGYDFIYQRYSGESFNGARLSKKWNVPFILEFNSSEVWKLKNWSKTGNPFKDALKKFIQLPITSAVERYNLKQSSLIVVVSEALRDNLMADGIPESKILINPNGVDATRFEKANGKLVRQKFKIDDHFVFGFIGTFGKWHGVLEMASAIGHFFTSNPELRNSVRFLIIGDGKLFLQFQEVLREQKVDDYVICTGNIPQSESPDHLLACDAFLSPHIPNPDGTKFFGSPTKLFEYMVCGKPIIASELDQIGEILTHEETALLTEPGNVEELSEAMIRLYKDQEMQSSLGRNARELVMQKYSWDAHVDRILERIKNLKSR